MIFVKLFGQGAAGADSAGDLVQFQSPFSYQLVNLGLSLKASRKGSSRSAFKLARHSGASSWPKQRILTVTTGGDGSGEAKR